MDVDGTLTDGGIYMGRNGELFKRFDVKDGYGIKNLLREHAIIPAIVTGRKSEILKNRCDELCIVELVQGSSDKILDCKKILDKYGFTPGEAAYIGDDLNDLEAMQSVRLKGCPHDAARKIKDIADYVTEADGGHGAVREFIEWICHSQT